MANPLQRLPLLTLLLSLSFHFLSADVSVPISSSLTPSRPPKLMPMDLHANAELSSLLSSILSIFGFLELASATTVANISSAVPFTLFLPSDSSLLTCPTCSLPLLLQEHTVPGLHSFHYLRTLSFGTKLHTVAPDRCLTVTATAQGSRVFVNGVEITEPDIFDNGLIHVHGIKGFVSHLSPLSCNTESSTSIALPPPFPLAVTSFSVMRFMLRDAVTRLRDNGYSTVASLLRAKSTELLELNSMTLFALKDVSIFAGEARTYLSNFTFHIVPNQRLMAADLVTLRPAAMLPTLERNQKLVVTTAGGGGLQAPMKINNVKITNFDLLHNSKIAVHGISAPFPALDHGTVENEPRGRSKCSGYTSGSNGVSVRFLEDSAPAGIKRTGDSEDHRGL